MELAGPLLKEERHFPGRRPPFKRLQGVDIDVDIDAMPAMRLKAKLKVTKVKHLTALVGHGLGYSD